MVETRQVPGTSRRIDVIRSMPRSNDATAWSETSAQAARVRLGQMDPVLLVGLERAQKDSASSTTLIVGNPRIACTSPATRTRATS